MRIVKNLIFLFTFIYIQNSHAAINQYFQSIQHNSPALYAFLKKMPKGGELHYHLAGGAYPETMLHLAAQQDYCFNTQTFAVEKIENPLLCQGVTAKNLLNQQKTYDQVIKAWSMKNFVPGEESGQDHFFNTFDKFMPLIADYESELLVEVLERAANQHVLYMEIMVLPDEARSLAFGDLIKDIPSLAEKRNLLLANADFQKNIAATISANDQMLQKARQIMHCGETNAQKGCEVTVQFLYYHLREQPIYNLFAQALNGFEAASRSKNIVGVNLVQPEDGLISLRDYDKQMEIFAWLHQQYPDVHIALHAGELAPGAVLPAQNEFHIHDAIFKGKAERIGHGVTIASEDNLEKTINYMANTPIPVEINLTSNQKILNVAGKEHPLRFYLNHQVPVVLSTDDEGILRTNLTQQYQKAVEEHGLDYATLKQINRNALTYSFMPGKSLWEQAAKAIPVKACLDLESSLCKDFIQKNPKAALQWRLERDLAAFEKSF